VAGIIDACKLKFKFLVLSVLVCKVQLAVRLSSKVEQPMVLVLAGGFGGGVGVGEGQPLNRAALKRLNNPILECDHPILTSRFFNYPYKTLVQFA
jgi:hypothetical protein